MKRDNTKLTIAHNQPRKGSATDGTTIVDSEITEAINELQAKMAGYPLPTPEVGAMTPPPPPQTSLSASAPTVSTARKAADGSSRTAAKAKRSAKQIDKTALAEPKDTETASLPVLKINHKK